MHGVIIATLTSPTTNADGVVHTRVADALLIVLVQLGPMSTSHMRKPANAKALSALAMSKHLNSSSH